jgi:hypothetical protein
MKGKTRKNFQEKKIVKANGERYETTRMCNVARSGVVLFCLREEKKAAEGLLFHG